MALTQNGAASYSDRFGIRTAAVVRTPDGSPVRNVKKR